MKMLDNIKSTTPIMALAKKLGHVANTDQEAIELLSNDASYGKFTEERFKIYRAALLSELRREALVTANSPTEFTVDFSGSGDSGNMDLCIPEDSRVDTVFEYALNSFVHFDWYNNDGGQGDMTWNITTDEITISGSYNEILSEIAMNEEVF